MRKRILSIVVALAMVLTMMPQIAAPVQAKTKTDRGKSGSVSESHHININTLSEDQQIVSGDVYVFAANITEDNNMTESDRKNRMLKSSPDISYYTSEDDAIDSRECRFDEYDDDVIMTSNNDNSYCYIITETDSTNDGNQGYTIKNYANGSYLDVKQDVQPITYGKWNNSRELKQRGGSTAWLADSFTCPTEPFVIHSYTPRVWYWDASKKEFYTLFSTTPYNDNYFGFLSAGYSPFYVPDGDGVEEGMCILAKDYTNSNGETRLSQLVWQNRYAYCDPTDMGIYEPGDPNDPGNPGKWASRCCLDRLTDTHGRNSKLYLQGINSRSQADLWGFQGVEEFRDPYYKWGKVHQTSEKGTAMLGLYHSAMDSEFNARGSQHSDWALAEHQTLSLYKSISTPKITFDYNDGTGGSRYDTYYYNQTLDLSNIKPYDETGSDFLGWSTEKHGEIITNLSAVENTTLYAQWKEINVNLTVVNGKFGSVEVLEPENFDGKVYKGDTFKAKATPNPNKTFNGWSISSSEGTDSSYDYEYETTCNTDLDVTVTFGVHPLYRLTLNLNYNDGSENSRQEEVYKYDTYDLSQFLPYEETGSDFLGWSLQPHGDIINSIKITSNEYLYAQWKKLNITAAPNDTNKGSVTVNTDGFDGTLYKGDSLSVTATPKDGFNFKGWKVGDNIVSTALTYETMYTQDTKLTALFECAGHIANETITKATPDADGSIVRTCDICGDEIFRSAISKPKTFELSKKAFTYNGSNQKPAITVKDADGRKIDLSNYDVLYSNNKNAGKATVKITFKGSFYSGTKTINFTINKAKNKLTVKGKKYKIKRKKLKKKSKKIKLSKVMKYILNGQGKMNFVKVSGSKKIKINTSTGKITIKKKIKKGTYKLKIKVMAAGDANHNASEWETVTIRVKVKK